MPEPFFIVGLGPGAPDLLTPQARDILVSSTCLAGYSLYLDLVPLEIKQGKRMIASGMRQERQRCEAAIDAALAGQKTALVCSGDPGIYAMASLCLEIMADRDLFDLVPFAVIPGIPALCAASAKLGAPLSHDFACISLSDLLTPWTAIEKRLHAAFCADFVCVLYNPRSRGRPAYLEQALNIASQYRSPACPVGFARNVGRQDEAIAIFRLDQFDPEQADMLSLVIIGNNSSRMAGSFMLTPRGYPGAKNER